VSLIGHVPPPKRGRVALAALAGGAAAAAALTSTPWSERDVVHLAHDTMDTDGGAGATTVNALRLPAVLQPVVIAPIGAGVDGSSLVKATRLAEQRSSESRRPTTARPTTGVVTSNFGPRWSTTHYGLDIANEIGTPVRSVAAGIVIDAGPASGFGLWVRIRLTDGTTTVYGHINRYFVRKGQRVSTGQLIAEIGNRGVSTGPHLHFEVIDARGRRTDPLAWLGARGVGYG